MRITNNPNIKKMQQKAYNQNIKAEQQINVSGKESASISISDRSQLLASAQNALKELPDVRQEKVLTIKEQIQNDTYEVSPKAVAKKMVSHFTMQREF